MTRQWRRCGRASGRRCGLRGAGGGPDGLRCVCTESVSRAEGTALTQLFAGGFSPHSSTLGPSGRFYRPQRGGRVKMAALGSPPLGRCDGRPSPPNMSLSPPQHGGRSSPQYGCVSPPTWRSPPQHGGISSPPPNMAAAPQRPKMAARRLRAASAVLPLPEEPQRDGTRRGQRALRRLQPLSSPPAGGWRDGAVAEDAALQEEESGGRGAAQPAGEERQRGGRGTATAATTAASRSRLLSDVRRRVENPSGGAAQRREAASSGGERGPARRRGALRCSPGERGGSEAAGRREGR